MKTLLILISCFCISYTVIGQTPKKSYYKFIEKAEQFVKAEDYKNANTNYSKAFESYYWRGFMNHRYDAARVWVKLGKIDSAFFYLERIARIGFYSDFEKMSTEQDFMPLHQDARWQSLLATVQENRQRSLPKGWFMTGNDLIHYQAFIDKGVGRNGGDAMSLKCINTYKDFSGLITQAPLEAYLGKRVRLSGYLKVENSNDAAFWIRMDKGTKVVAFANMMEKKNNRSIKGTKDWAKYEIVIDVPLNAEQMFYGVVYEGMGQLWVEDLTLEIVDAEVPLTQ